MKRGIIVTVIYLVWTGVVLFAAHAVAYQGPQLLTPAELEHARTGLVLWVLAWLVSTGVVGVMWVVLLIRWALGSKSQTPAQVGYTQPPASPPPREQYSITGRRIR